MKANTKLTVWTRAGGRCVICKRYLLNDLQGDVKPIGQVAHNVGRTDAPGSPRGQAHLPLDERDDPDNLLLLCPDDHLLADTKRLEARYTPQVLEELKRDHESAVEQLTGLMQGPTTLILRVIGTVRGATARAGRREAAAIVAANGRFPSYLPNAHHAEIEIDLRHFEEDSDWYWDACCDKIHNGIERVADGVRSEEIDHVSVIAFARIPLLVYLGWVLDDTYSVDIHQRYRTTDSWVRPTDPRPVAFRTRNERSDARAPEEAVLLINASGTIHPHELPVQLQTLPRYIVEPRGVAASTNVADHPDSLAAYSNGLRLLLADLEKQTKTVRQLHLVMAAPLSMAVETGRVMNPQIHPRIVVYDRSSDGGRYEPVLELEQE